MNFTVIDFETATYDRMPCQLGLVVVRDGRIVEENQWLIKPPGNKYDSGCIQVHGIRPEDTISSPEFFELWDEIKPYLDNKIIVCHNCDFDSSVLNKAIEYYNLHHCSIIEFICTQMLFLDRGLEDVTTALNIELCNHHDALCDARACAEIYLSFLNGTNPYTLSYPPQKSKKEKLNDYYRKKILSAEVKVQDLSIVENKNTPFYDKKVVISGVFERFPEREDLAMLLKKYGANINCSISSKTNLFITGKGVGHSKMAKASNLIESGIDIQIINEQELYEILDSE
jgi:DNA polymerase-3 subunit epsilon